MTHLYDMDIKFYGGVGKYLFFVTKRIDDENLGDTLMTIDIHEKGVLLSTSDGADINPKASALAQTYCDMLRREMIDVLALTDEQCVMWKDLIDEYIAIGIDHPMAVAYDEVRRMIKKQSQPDMDNDRDVM